MALMPAPNSIIKGNLTGLLCQIKNVEVLNKRYFLRTMILSSTYIAVLTVSLTFGLFDYSSSHKRFHDVDRQYEFFLDKSKDEPKFVTAKGQ